MSESKLIHNHLLINENDSSLVDDGVRYDFRGDYLGFTFDGVHSSKLGIVRTSDGDKYNENLTPTFSDITATVPGLDKTYYFGSNFTQATATIKFSFDSLTDTQIRELKRLFSQKEPKDLIFDEAPYKVYSAKPQSIPTLSYLCFDKNGQRIYKGEGTITFVAYSPFARSRFKYLDDYTLENIPEWKGSIDDTGPEGILNNKGEWEDSSGIISPSNSKLVMYNIDICQRVGSPNRYRFLLHNPGDCKNESKILLKFNNNNNDNNIKIFLAKGQVNPIDEYAGITIDIDKLPDNSINNTIYGVVIDNKTKLIHPLIQSFEIDGRSSNNSTLWTYDDTIILNYIISAGDFFAIPTCNYDDYYYIRVNTPNQFAVDYKYLYY